MTCDLHEMTAARSTVLLNSAAVAEQVSALGAPWHIDDGNLTYFAQPDTMTSSAAVASQAAAIAEQINHHPNIALGYHTLRISITTHDSGGLTALDFAFAAQLELWRRAQTHAALAAAPV